jgi:cytochrome bd-type quinol oxidase subunit 2
MSKASEDKTEFRTRDRWLLTAFALGPLTALTHLSVSYALVPTACDRASKTMLHVTTAVALLLCIVAGAIAAAILRRCATEDARLLWQQRTRWFATTALVLAIFSAVVILAMEIPNVILRSCD